jgi:hypothetical protein
MDSKKCCGCKQVKSTTEFYKNKSYKDGFQSYCKPCNTANNEKYYQDNKDSVDGYRKQWRKDDRKKNSTKWLAYELKARLRRFGTDLEWYEKQNEIQDGRCAICGKIEDAKHQNGSPVSLAVDHNHTTGKVRGLLCRLCNHALHNLDKDRGWAQKALEYLEKYD